MNPVKLILGFVPFILFTVLTGWIPIGWAAAAGLVAALAVVAVSAAGGIKVLPLVQAVILLVIAVLGFAAGPATVAFLTVYGRGLASLALGLFIVATAARTPFTAQSPARRCRSRRGTRRSSSGSTAGSVWRGATSC